jgi:hypothetical protein
VSPDELIVIRLEGRASRQMRHDEGRSAEALEREGHGVGLADAMGHKRRAGRCPVELAVETVAAAVEAADAGKVS